MKQKRSIYRVLLYVFIIIFVFKMILERDAYGDIRILFISNLFEMLGLFFPIFIFLLAKNSAKKKVMRESLSEVDFKNDKEYYREILKNYSPGVLSYVDNFEIDYIKDIVAILLNLELKKKIEIKNNYIKILDSKVDDIKNTEKYILDNIKDGKVKLLDYNSLEKHVKEEALESKLIIKNEVSKKLQGSNKELLALLIMIGIPFFVGMLFIFVFVFGEMFIDYFITDGLVSIDDFLWLFVLILFVPVIMRYALNYLFINKYFYGKYKNKSYSRTLEGEELNKRIEGLRNYINDFSMLDEKERNELLLWEDYLIYSVIFDLNDNIVNELSLLIEVD